MAMNNYYRRNNARTNQPDCFKPWQTQRNKSCSPSRNPKCFINTHRAFAGNTRPGRTPSPIKGKDSLHTVFFNHLRRQIPAEYQPKLQVMYKRGKDNQNIKLKKEAVHPKLKYSRNVYFENDIKLYSSSATNMSSNTRIQSVRHVIEKFNNLSKNATDVPAKHSFKEKKKDIVPIHEVETKIQSYSKETVEKISNDKNRKTMKNIPIHEVETKIQSASIKETVKKINNDKNRKTMKNKLSGAKLRSKLYYKEREYAKLMCDDLLDVFKPAKMESVQRNSCKRLVLNMERSKELVSAHTQTTPCPSATNIMINVYNQQSPRLIQHGHQQSPRLIQHVHEQSPRLIQHVHQQSPRLIQHGHEQSPRLIQHGHQQSPRLIQHVHQQSPRLIQHVHQQSPRLIQHGHEQLKAVKEIKICQDRNQNAKLSISQETEKEDFETTKRSVRDCIKKFEEHLNKKGMETEINDPKIFAKIRSNYFLKKEYEPNLSSKAKSVPF